MADYIQTSQVVVVTGIRRCGKSSLLFLIKQQMLLQEEQYLYFNFDDERIIGEFDYFFQKGGFPLVIKENDLEILEAYFKDILYRDIVARFRLSQVDELKQMGLYFCANTSKLFSYSTLQKVSGVKSLSTVKDYLSYYAQSYLFFYLSKFDYSVKKQILNPKKVYSIDQGFINRIGFNFTENKGRILENIVFLELLRRKKEVYYYSSKGECDFVVKEALIITQAIQVCYFLNKENFDREMAGLLQAMKEFNLQKGLLIVHDSEIDETKSPPQITIIPIWKWLLTDH